MDDEITNVGITPFELRPPAFPAMGRTPSMRIILDKPPVVFSVITDADVERIAHRVVELLGERRQ